MTWFARNRHGFWCNFCGELLKPYHYFDGEHEWEDYETYLDDGECPNCGAPENFDPDAI